MSDSPEREMYDRVFELVMQWTDEDLHNFAVFVSGYSPELVDVYEKRRLNYRRGSARELVTRLEEES